MGFQVGVDIGGTFTDLYVVDEDRGEMGREKVPTTPDEFSRGFVDALERAFERRGIAPEDVTYLAHGTTVATNAMLEREGVATGLLTTAGFRDVTAIGREDRENVYDLSPPKTPTFTRRRHRTGVRERIAADGTVVEPLDEADVERAADALAGEVDSVAVSLLHAYRNDDHERRVREILEDRTDLDVALSSVVMPEIREYERTLSTVIDAYVGPIVDDYVDRIESRIDDAGIGVDLHLMQANGGVTTTRNLGRRRLRLVNSGPAAGVIGAARAAASSGVDTIITLDMGGTSADVCAVRDGAIETTTEGELDGVPLLFPQVDVRTIGSGGGSIAWLDPTDVLKVGPRSAGADPGPACYGRGGDDPTVTDAALVLGYLDPDSFLGGEMTLDVGRARGALSSIAGTLDRDPVALADGILDIAATDMTGALRLVTVEKGYDPRGFTLTCYGGAGPLFATRLARALDVERALIPAAPGVLSARGLLGADKRFTFSRSTPLRFDASNRDAIADIYDGLEERASAVSTPDSRVRRAVDLRYAGQTSKLTVDFPGGDPDADALEMTAERFHERYASIYDHSHPEEAIEGVTWRLRISEETETVREPEIGADGTVEAAITGSRDAYTDDGFREFTVYDRYALPPGGTFPGPAIVEEAESTTVIGPDATVTVDDNGNLLVDLPGGE